MGHLNMLLARPIAHRGLHDAAAGVIENTIGAARAAIAANYAIECDVQATLDGAAVVFHDDELDRLTDSTGYVRDRSLADLQHQRLRGTAETIPCLAEFVAAISGRTPLVIELKSYFDGDMRLPQAVIATLRNYRGAVCIESFDPAMIAFLRDPSQTAGLAHIPLGVVAEAHYTEQEWPRLSAHQRREMTHFLHYPQTQPDFISWSVSDLPHAIPFLARQGLRLPVTTWTVRTPDQAQQARQWADQIVFENFAPA